MRPTAAGQALLQTFDHIRIINLAHRSDRRREMTAELARLGIAVDGDRVAFHPAAKFDDRGGFRTVGARGCFHSHLGILRSFAETSRPLLILEDDADFARNVETLMPRALTALAKCRWSLFYGFMNDDSHDSDRVLVKQPASIGVSTTHFVGFQSGMASRVADYMDAMLDRPEGSPAGGPMDVDGAYSWFRAAHPEFETWQASPELAHQRASRTDITPSRWDEIPLLREARNIARMARRRFSR